jgi:hypothetical protein
MISKLVPVKCKNEIKFKMKAAGNDSLGPSNKAEVFGLEPEAHRSTRSLSYFRKEPGWV